MSDKEPNSPRIVVEPTQTPAGVARGEQIEASETHNLVVLAAHYIFLRMAWVFKTESVLMPAFMDSIAGAGWLRGCLPVLNRLGQSVPPLLFADRLKRTRRKKWVLCMTPMLMATPFVILSIVWFALENSKRSWLPAFFLICYLLFFSANGLNQLAYGTVQGKLIRPDRRGRLLSLSGVIGSVFSVTCVWFLLQSWLRLPDNGFGYIFGFSGMGFVAAGLCITAVREPSDHVSTSPRTSTNYFRDAWGVFCRDQNFRRVAVVGMFFNATVLLFPHFQALGRTGKELQDDAMQLVSWVIAQNISVGLFSLATGFVADRYGNRLVIRYLVFSTSLAPLLALLLTSPFLPDGRRFYWLTFLLLGMAPVTFKTLVNYTLELAEPPEHPRYVSTLSVCLAIPFCLSPLVGLLVDVLGFTTVFLTASAAIACGGLLTFRMSEPRHQTTRYADSIDDSETAN